MWTPKNKVTFLGYLLYLYNMLAHTLTPYHTLPKISFYYPLIWTKNCWMSGKQCWPWSETVSCSINCLTVFKAMPILYEKGYNTKPYNEKNFWDFKIFKLYHSLAKFSRWQTDDIIPTLKDGDILNASIRLYVPPSHYLLNTGQNLLTKLATRLPRVVRVCESNIFPSVCLCIHTSICSPHYLLQDHWAEFNQTCYMISPRG